jgi:type IV secretion system protein VirB2
MLKTTRTLMGNNARKAHQHTSALMFALLTAPAFAGAGGGISSAMQKAKSLVEEANTGLMALGVTVVTIAVMFVGFRMIFRAGQWADLAPIFWGGLLVGGSATVAGALM